jgi:hypothetical protein
MMRNLRTGNYYYLIDKQQGRRLERKEPSTAGWKPLDLQ